ncbi:hypothetical protein LTR74_010692 [Friedmanniomyces endolithicus]|nr:hypothetical protein LTR74_010692 [Friedmanniomyces endolithicus]
MGAKPSAPIPGTKLRVLALGLPRTGTSSISAALEILLNGPSYHGGAHMAQGSMSHMRKWMRCHRISYDARHQGRELTSSERASVLALLAEQYEGFASVSDTPAFYYAEELCEVFPEAVVIVTTRDVDAWWASKMEINALMRDWQRVEEVVLWPVPQGIGYWPAFSRLLLGGAYGEHLGRPGREVYERHVEYVKSVVPAERLFFFDMKEGWAPLCKILGKNMPDVPFPRLNEREAFRRILWEKLRLGMLCWAVLIGVGATASQLLVSWLGRED